MSKRILITGASSGIGAEFALMASEMGHSLVLLARREAMLRELAAQCREHGAPIAAVVCGDLCSEQTVSEAVRTLRSLPGEPVLINNAGMAEFGDFAATEWENHQRLIQVNLVGTMCLTHSVLPVMQEHGSGQIVNVLSIAADQVFSGAATYSATKAGLRQFGKCLSAEVRGKGIRVTQLLPGATDTPLWDAQGGSPPREKMLSASNVARGLAYLISLAPDQVIDEVTITPPLGVL